MATPSCAQGALLPFTVQLISLHAMELAQLYYTIEKEGKG